VVFAWQAHPRYPLVLAANRDEFFDRPTDAAGWWTDNIGVLAGRDLRAHGTWLGITRWGRFAALTNFRSGVNQRPDAPSRGVLVEDFLTSAQTPDEFLQPLSKNPGSYNGFSLLAGQLSVDQREGEFMVVSNHSATPAARITPGVHALSNALIDDPWPKVVQSQQRLRALIAETPSLAELQAGGFALLADTATARDADLPSTGITHDWERALSAVFIRMQGYGTRSSTLLVCDQRGEITFVERSFTVEGHFSERDFRFSLEAN